MIVGFTSGSWDLTHPGHVRFLEACKAQCDRLTVMVGRDEQVRAAKGPSRPVLPAPLRLAMLRALRCVDHAFIDAWGRFDLEGLGLAFDNIVPRVNKYFCADESHERDRRIDLCADRGIEFILIPDKVRVAISSVKTEVLSTSWIVNRVREGCHARIA